MARIQNRHSDILLDGIPLRAREYTINHEYDVHDTFDGYRQYVANRGISIELTLRPNEVVSTSNGIDIRGVLLLPEGFQLEEWMVAFMRTWTKKPTEVITGYHPAFKTKEAEKFRIAYEIGRRVKEPTYTAKKGM